MLSRDGICDLPQKFKIKFSEFVLHLEAFFFVVVYVKISTKTVLMMPVIVMKKILHTSQEALRTLQALELLVLHPGRKIAM